MANNYLESSFAITDITEEEIKWWQEESKRYDYDGGVEPDDLDPPCSVDWQLDRERNMVWFHGDESIDIESASSVIQRFLKECRPEESVGFTWAETCSKPRLDVFGGGGCFITADNIEWNSAHGWLIERMQAHAS